MKTRIALIAAAASAATAFGGSAIASQPAQQPGTMDASRVTAGTYAFDPAHTLVEWEVSHFGFNPYVGLFGDVEGTLTMDPANIEAAELDVTIPIMSLSVVSEGLRDHMLRPGEDGGDPDFFGANPGNARFVSTDLRSTGATTALIHGELTMLGTTRPVAIAAQFTGAGANPMNQAETVGFTGRARIKRSEFGMNFGIPAISDEVDLTISAAFEKQ